MTNATEDGPRCMHCGAEDYEPLCPSCQDDYDENLARVAQMIVDGWLNGQVHGGGAR